MNEPWEFGRNGTNRSRLSPSFAREPSEYNSILLYTRMHCTMVDYSMVLYIIFAQFRMRETDHEWKKNTKHE